MDFGNWCLIESDPGVFTELISGMGVRGVQVEEIWSLDHAADSLLKPVYGLIFLFKWQKNGNPEEQPQTEQHATDHIFFANQVINNACATQAILSILLNRDDIDIGPELRNFKEFTADFSPDMKGMAISNSDMIRTVHNSFARSDPFVNEMRDPRSSQNDDVYHFIAYLPIHGALYELDGLSKGPVYLGACNEDDWLTQANQAIMARMARYGTSELHFSLMAVTRDKLEAYQEQLEETEGLLFSLSDDASEERHQLEIQKATLEQKLLNEKNKREMWHRENILRKHNMVPLIYNILRLLAERKELQPAVAEAKAKAAESTSRNPNKKA